MKFEEHNKALDLKHYPIGQSYWFNTIVGEGRSQNLSWFNLFHVVIENSTLVNGCATQDTSSKVRFLLINGNIDSEPIF